MDFIKKYIIKLNFILLIASVTIIPFISWYNFNFSVEKTYEKKYYLIKEDDFDYIKKISLNNSPIINSETLEKYIVDAVVDIFNYEPRIFEVYLEKNKDYFSNIGYSNFENTFSEAANIEDSNGVVYKQAIVIDGPYLLGKAKLLSGERIWQYVLKIKDLSQGLEDRDLKTRSVVVILKESNFSKNNKGVTIDSIQVK